MLLLSLLPLVAQLQAATIDVQIAGDSATVEATYVFTEAEPVTFVLIRRPDQIVQRLQVVGGGPFITEEATGLIRIAVEATDTTIRITYLARGRLVRIPLPVPDQPSVPGPPGVRIRISGLASEARLNRSFPRLLEDGPSVAVATLANVPSLIRLPPQPGGVSVTQAAEWFVVLLILGSSAAWIARTRRRRTNS